jgi:hypothetical protein
MWPDTRAAAGFFLGRIHANRSSAHSAVNDPPAVIGGSERNPYFAA